MRRLLWVVVGLVVLLVVADRVAVSVAQSQVATRIQREQQLVERPDVSIGGFPFLTQAIAGRYDDVTLTLHGLRRGPVAVTRLTAHLSGVHVPLSDVLGEHLGEVPVDRATAQVFVAWSDLNRWLADRGLTIGPAPGDRVRLTATRDVGGRRVEAGGVGRLSVSRDAVTVTAAGGVTVTIPLPGLPFRIRFLHATPTETGLSVGASASGLVLRAGRS